MYCPSCGTPVTATLSFCNRCGAGLRERVPVKNNAAIIAILTAITALGLGGMGIMIGGSIALSKDAGLPHGFVAFFMFFIFLITAVTEVFLVKNLSRLTSSTESKPAFHNTQQKPLELQPPGATSFVEPLGSVTDNTTRTLEYATREKVNRKET
jgi:hypothetical protein